MSLAASRFLSRLQSSLRDTKPLRSSFSTYCNKHTHVPFNSLCWTASQKQKRKSVSFLHERPWRYWRNTKNFHTDRSTAAWMPATDGNKHALVWQQHCCILQREGFSPFYCSHISCPKRWCGTAAVILWTGIMAAACTWARLTLHVYIALQWAQCQRVVPEGGRCGGSSIILLWICVSANN